MRHRHLSLHPALRHIISVAVVVAWSLGVVLCCNSGHSGSEMPRMRHSSLGAVGHHVVHHELAVVGDGAALTQLCPHRCGDFGAAIVQTCAIAAFVALIVIVAMTALAAPFTGPIAAGTRDPPVPIRSYNQYLGRDILDRICICRC